MQPTTEVNGNPSSVAVFALLDDDGFLIAPALWSRDLAMQLAEIHEIGPLREEHWQVISYVRQKYLYLGAPPLMRNVCRCVGLTRTEARSLFGSCLQVWRLAGLPNPGEEARSYGS